MPDLYSQITEVPNDILEGMIRAMELRAADPNQQAIRQIFLGWVTFPPNAKVLEVGCGSGAVCRELAQARGVGEVLGVDPSPVFIARARDLAAGIGNLGFVKGDARSLPLDENEFDVVLFHTCLTHVPGPEAALKEAFRVLRRGGQLVIYDGDYSTTTIGLGADDPLQTCVEAAMNALVNDRWLVRRLVPMTKSAGFDIVRFHSHGYVQPSEPDYMMTLVTRGADILAASGRIGVQLADSLKEEGKRRVREGTFFGFIAFASLIAAKPR
jgi:ubiquinone/menaquinone biosynthesis C-methylase UbiE